MITTKDYVLYWLKKTGDFLSGEEISRKIGVSRAAVHTAVKSLRNEGYEIESVTNKGYRLTDGGEPLSVGELLAWLSPERAERITVLDCVDSTNTYLKRLVAEGKAMAGDCVIANQQTGGRGRLGRQFESPMGKGIYLSFVLGLKKVDPTEISAVTAWGAIAVRKAIETVCGISCGIKWVNDLVYRTRKICGILTELTLEGETGKIQSVIMGIGINVNQQKHDFSSQTAEIASSLEMICGHPVRRAQLCAAVIHEIDRLCDDFPAERERYLACYRKHCVNIGNPVILQRGDEDFHGEAVGVNDRFELTVRLQDGSLLSVTGGDVRIRGFYGTEA